MSQPIEKAIPIKLTFSTDNVSNIVYDGMEIVLQRTEDGLNSNLPDYYEEDILDALCRARLLVVEKFNRKLPNDERHFAYKDLDIQTKQKITNIFKTDHARQLIISYRGNDCDPSYNH